MGPSRNLEDSLISSILFSLMLNISSSPKKIMMILQNLSQNKSKIGSIKEF